MVEWGKGVYGAEAAARRYSECRLGPDQKPGRHLAAMLPDPLRRSPDSRIVKTGCYFKKDALGLSWWSMGRNHQELSP